MPSLPAVGQFAPRVDGITKVRGTLAFPSDVYPQDVLHCRPVFTPYPHAKILNVEIKEALAVPGVVRVLRAQDLPGPNTYSFDFDRPIFCDDRALYEGDIVAMVIAESETAAEAGVKRVKVDYTPLPLLTDPEQALFPDAPQLHASGNILHQIHYRSGDPEAIFASGDVVVLEQTFQPPITDHVFLETEAGTAFPEDGGIRLVTGGQDAFYHQGQVAHALQLPPEKVRVIEPYTGGGFGGKADVNVQILVSVAAHLTGRPCRMVWTRHEHFITGVKRHPAVMRLRGAATRQGEFLALQARIISDTGAYGIHGNVVLDVLVECLTGPYAIPNVRIDAWSVYTNNYLGGAFRGFGANKGCLAIEGHVSSLARAIGMDELEFRKRNLIKQGGRGGSGHELMAPIHAIHALDAASQHPLWKNRRDEKHNGGPVRRGVGMALGLKGYCYGSGDAGDYGAAELTLGFEGRVRLSAGAVEIGQGSFTTLAQIAAETLHCNPDLFDVICADTQESVNSGTTGASRTTYAVGRAIVAAAQDLAVKIQNVTGQVLQVPPESIRLEDGTAQDSKSGRALTFEQVVQHAEEPLTASKVVRVAYSEVLTPGTAVAHPHNLYASSAQLAQVAVDTETGEIAVEHMVTFPDIGRVLYRDGLEGQIHGGIAQGLGYALMEQVIIKDGRIQNADLATYSVPTSMDMPEIEIHPIEVPDPTGPLGAKGMGELATVPVAPAILDAIEDAIGVRFTTMPVTPERVLEALDAARSGGQPGDRGLQNGK